MTDQQQNAAPQDENKLIAQRREKLQSLRDKGNAFPNDFRRDSLAADLHTRFANDTKEVLEAAQHPAKVAGRLIRMRGPFMVIQDGSAQIQLYLNHK
jgi:lysyl-tRNA synthetase, class II